MKEKFTLHSTSIWIVYPNNSAFGVAFTDFTTDYLKVWGLLIKNYKKTKKVERLIKLGQIDYLGKNLTFPKGIKRPKPNFENSEETIIKCRKQGVPDYSTPIELAYQEHSVTYSSRQVLTNKVNPYISRIKPYHLEDLDYQALEYYGHGNMLVFDVRTKSWNCVKFVNYAGKKERGLEIEVYTERELVDN